LRNPHFPDVPITFEQLLTHRSSIRDNEEAYDGTYVCGDSPVALGDWLKGYFTPGGAYWSEDNWHQWPPGTANPPAEPQSYSNVGFGVVGYLVELLSRRPFPVYCREEIFEPMGMRYTGWLLRDIDVTRHATPYLRLPDQMTPEQVALYGPLAAPGWDLKTTAPGTLLPLRLYSHANYPDGSLRTSANELARFLAAILAQGRAFHGRLLKASTVDLMFSGNHFGGHLCWGTRKLPDGRTVILHSGAELGVTSFIAFEASSRIGVVCVRNFRVTKEDNTRLITLLLEAGHSMGG
jgi:CubicO group peptidase (beta-lactamase class C family)